MYQKMLYISRDDYKIYAIWENHAKILLQQILLSNEHYSNKLGIIFCLYINKINNCHKTSTSDSFFK